MAASTRPADRAAAACYPAGVTDSQTVARQVAEHFGERVPHNKALGLQLLSLGDDGVVVELPYRDELVGNPDDGVLHGGAISGQIDAACSMAVFARLGRATSIATLDLRIDYLKPARPGSGVLARAECYKITSQVAFVRAFADCGDEADPVASAAGTFIIFGDGAGAREQDATKTRDREGAR